MARLSYKVSITTKNPILVQALSTIVDCLQKQLSMTEMKYIFARQLFYEDMLKLTCVEEFLLNSDIFSLTMPFQILDYLSLSIIYMNSKDQFSNILLCLVDNFEIIDQVLKNGKYVKLILQYRNYFPKRSFNRDIANKLISHIAKKFPAILNMQYMHRKIAGKLVPSFTKEDIDIYY